MSRNGHYKAFRFASEMCIPLCVTLQVHNARNGSICKLFLCETAGNLLR